MQYKYVVCSVSCLTCSMRSTGAGSGAGAGTGTGAGAGEGEVCSVQCRAAENFKFADL